MVTAERVSGLRHQVAAKTSELHALQRELLNAERTQRRGELQLLATTQGSAAGPHGLVVEQGLPPEAVISRGFPTSRSEIHGEWAEPTLMRGSVHVESNEATVFQVPRSRPIVAQHQLAAGETGKGPTLVKLFG